MEQIWLICIYSFPSITNNLLLDFISPSSSSLPLSLLLICLFFFLFPFQSPLCLLVPSCASMCLVEALPHYVTLWYSFYLSGRDESQANAIRFIRSQHYLLCMGSVGLEHLKNLEHHKFSSMLWWVLASCFMHTTLLSRFIWLIH